MKLRLSLLFIFSFTLFVNASFAQSHQIKVTVEGLKDTSLILGYYFNKQIFVQDTAYATAHSNTYVFKGDEPLKQGVYVVYLPDKSYFDLLIGEDQIFDITTPPTDFVQHLKITGSSESQSFLDYQRFLSEKQKEAKVIQEKMQASKDDKTKTEKYRQELLKLSKEVETFWSTIYAKHPNTFLAAFLKALQEVEVPMFEAPAGSQNPDSVIQRKRYQYYKDHYFDNIDLTDERLLRTPFFTDKLERFFTQTLVQIPDTLSKEAHKVIAKSEPNEDMYKYLVQYLFNMANDSKVMGMDAMMVNLGETYYLSGKATWADSTFLSKLEERVIKLKPNLLGNVAPDFKMPSYTGEFYRLSEIHAPLTILIFWEPDCGHCKKEVPKLKEEVWDKYADKGIKIVAVYTHVDIDPWKEFISEHALEEWINVYDPYNRTNFRNNYDIYSTPVVYILDSAKKILAKRIGAEQIPGFLDHYFKFN